MSGRPTILAGPEFVEANGVRLAVWERSGTEPPVFFAHATGLHARTWNQIVARIPGRRCLAFDMRGHGLSARPEAPYHWHVFGEDTAALARALGLRGATGVGHSMGGHSLALAATIVPEAFAELILVDPVIMPPALYTGRPREPHFAHTDQVINEALRRANMSRDDIDLLIYTGLDKRVAEPGQSFFIAKAMGMLRAQCFDITEGCGSWTRALSSFAANGLAR